MFEKSAKLQIITGNAYLNFKTSNS